MLNYANQNYNYTGAPVMGGVKPFQMTNMLTKEAATLLQKGGVGDNVITVTEEDAAKAICPHRNLRGESTVNQNPDGTYTCTLCGDTYRLIENEDFVEQVTEEALNIFNTIKVTWLDIPVEFGREYMKIIPFIKQLPKVYRAAMNSFNNYESQNTISGVVGTNPWALYNSLGSGIGPYTAPAPGMQYNAMAQPAQQSQPIVVGTDFNGNPIYGQPQNQQANVAQAAPQVNGFLQQPYGSGVQSTAQAMQQNEVKLPNEAVTNTVTKTSTLNLD